MNDHEKLRAAAKAVLDEVDPFNDEGPMRCVPAKDLTALHKALGEKPLKINDLTVDQRIASLDEVTMNEADLVKAGADHLHELYSAYDRDTKQVHDDRDSEIAELERNLTESRSERERLGMLCYESATELDDTKRRLTGLDKRFRNWKKTVYVVRDERDRLLKGLALLQDLRGLTPSLDCGTVSFWATELGHDIRAFLESQPSADSAHTQEASPGESDKPQCECSSCHDHRQVLEENSREIRKGGG